MTGWAIGRLPTSQIGELMASVPLAVVRRDHVAVRPREIGDPAGQSRSAAVVGSKVIMKLVKPSVPSWVGSVT